MRMIGGRPDPCSLTSQQLRDVTREQNYISALSILEPSMIPEITEDIEVSQGVLTFKDVDFGNEVWEEMMPLVESAE